MTTGTEADCSTISCLFKRLGITRQNNKHIALHRSEEKCGEFIAEMMIVCLLCGVMSLVVTAIKATAACTTTIMDRVRPHSYRLASYPGHSQFFNVAR